MEVWERKFPLHVLTWKNKHLILDKLFIDYQKDHKKVIFNFLLYVILIIIIIII